MLFDDLEQTNLAEHVASNKPIALAEVAPAFAEGAEFCRVVQGERSLFNFVMWQFKI